MPKDNLPLKVDPFRFADNASHLHGHLLVNNMQRLTESLAGKEGEVEIGIDFGIDEQGVKYLRGHLTTQLMLRCQRCMESFGYNISGNFALGIIQTEEEANDLPVSYDPLIVKGNELFIQDVIEDELIVSLPIVPMHDTGHCKVKLPLEVGLNGTSKMENDNPFKVIELLRSKRDK